MEAGIPSGAHGQGRKGPVRGLGCRALQGWAIWVCRSLRFLESCLIPSLPENQSAAQGEVSFSLSCFA